MKSVILALGAALVTFWAPPAHAQTSAPPVHYTAGWNMTTTVGMQGINNVPPTATVSRWGYDPANGQYVNLNIPAMFTPCTGVWEYFSAPVDAVPASGSVNRTTTIDCSLEQGWNMIGNSFAYPARLPDGTTGFFWDTAINAYRAVSIIPVGASVWVFAPSAQSLTLRSAGPEAFVPVIKVGAVQVLRWAGSDWAPATAVHAGDHIRLTATFAATEPAGTWFPPCVAGSVRISRGGTLLASVPVQCPTPQPSNALTYVYADVTVAGSFGTGTLAIVVDLSYDAGIYGIAQGYTSGTLAVSA